KFHHAGVSLRRQVFLLIQNGHKMAPSYCKESSLMSSTPLWTPNTPQSTQLARFMETCGMPGANYQAFWRWSIDHSPEFWNIMWDFGGLIGDKGDIILQDAEQMPGARFFPQARINYAENLLRRRDDAPAII